VAGRGPNIVAAPVSTTTTAEPTQSMRAGAPAPTQQTFSRGPSARAFAQAMKNPRTLRNAIILSEILQPPLSMR
jgi:hypothetical protein